MTEENSPLNAVDEDASFNAQFASIREAIRQRDQPLQEWMATQPQVIQCELHNETRPIDVNLTRRSKKPDGGGWTASYAPCLKCEEEKETRTRLFNQGVPRDLLHASFDTWKASSDQDREKLACVQEYALHPRGYLFLLGGVGTGKSHLAVAVMRQHKSSLFIKQSELLRRLRDTYSDRSAKDPVEVCQKAGLLVLDDAGLSGGGKDEMPMLHDILDYRYSNFLPTILTSNLAWEALSRDFGHRITDRLDESTFAVIQFDGPSHRHERRDKYLGIPPTSLLASRDAMWRVPAKCY